MSVTVGTFLVFLVLKLTHVIAWSWLWITCPLWAGFAIFGAIFLRGALGLSAGVGVSSLLNRRRRK